RAPPAPPGGPVLRCGPVLHCGPVAWHAVTWGGGGARAGRRTCRGPDVPVADQRVRLRCARAAGGAPAARRAVVADGRPAALHLTATALAAARPGGAGGADRDPRRG